MALTDSVSIDESAENLIIESLRVEDPEIIDFLSDHDTDQQVELITEALSVGIKTMRLMDTSQDVEYIERRLSDLEDDLSDDVETLQEELHEKLGDDGDLQESLEQHVGEDGTLQDRIESAFDDDGPFVERLNKELGEDGERIQNALDPDNEDSPTYRLEKRLKDEIRSVRDRVVEEQTEEDMRGQTYFKGEDFEEKVHSVLNEIVRQTANNATFTGDSKGETGREVGDFVVNLADTGQKIAIEAKTEEYSVDAIKHEMEKAIQNRNAAYGIFVTDTLENLPRTKTGWFHEYPEQNTVVVAMSEAAEDDVEPGYLRIAFSWARMRAVQSYAEMGTSFDPEELHSELDEIEEDIDRFKTIRGQCTEIKNSRERIEKTLTDIERSIKSRLATIEAELTKADAE